LTEIDDRSIIKAESLEPEGKTMFQMHQTDAPENFSFLDTSFDIQASADNLRWLWVAHILRDEKNRVHRDQLPELANDVFYAA